MVVQTNLDLRVQPLELEDKCRQEPVCNRRQGEKFELAATRASPIRTSRHHLLNRGQHAAGLGEKLDARRCQSYRAGRTLDQAHADLLFELSDGLAECRLADVHFFRRRDERPGIHDSDERAQVAEIWKDHFFRYLGKVI